MTKKGSKTGTQKVAKKCQKSGQKPGFWGSGPQKPGIFGQNGQKWKKREKMEK